MNAELLLREFHCISEAPDAIFRLRQFLLDLAIRGRLVQQVDTDGSAAHLLDEIRSRRQKLLAQKEIRAVRADYERIAAGDPSELPTNWARATLGDICDLQTGATPSTSISAYFGGDIRWLVSGDISKGEIYDCEGRITTAGLQASNCKILPPDSVMIALNGQGKTRGTVAILRVPAACNQSLVALIPILRTCLLPEYLFWNLRARYLPIRHLTGHEDRRGLNMKLLSCFSLSLPPVAEQHRIVSRLNELMTFCDELEAAKAAREAHRDELVAASIHRLSSDPVSGQSSFHDSVRFYSNHLPILTTRVEHVHQLRNAILELAVRGRLTKQNRDSNQENQGTLLFPIPSTWAWHRIGEIATQVTDGEHATPPRVLEKEVPLITAKNVRGGLMDYSNTDWVSRETAEKAWQRCRPQPGDILLVCVGATTGRLCILREHKEMVLVRSVALVRPSTQVSADFLALALRSPFCQKQIWSSVKVSAQPCLYINRINSLMIPLPPLDEQQYIVTKVNQLNASCEEIENQIDTRTQLRESLLKATLHHALGSLETRSEIAAGA